MQYRKALAFVLATSFATAAQAQSFVGEWTATAHLNGFNTSETLTVVKTDQGYAITGKAVDAPPGSPEAGPGTEVVIDGDKFSYKRKLQIGANSNLVLAYEGTVSGDTFTGTADLGGTKVPYTGVRIARGK